MKLDRVNLNQKLGQGTFGKIYPYQKNPDCQKYVVKVRNDLEFGKLKNALQEVIVGFNLDNPAILAYKDFHIEQNNEIPGSYRLYIKMPRMKMSLKQLLDNQLRPLPKKVVLEYTKTLLSGLKFLAQKKIAHRDIKPANILVRFDDTLVIGDLGEAKHSLDDDTTGSQLSIKGTVPYMAPELFSLAKGKKLKKEDLLKADLWSMGVTILEICLLGKTRINSISSLDSAAKRQSEMFQDLVEVSRQYGDDLSELLLTMLHWDPNERRSIQDVCQNFEKKFRSNNINNNRGYQEEEKMSFRTSKSLTSFNSNDPQKLPAPLCSSNSLPDYFWDHYNSVNNHNGEEEMNKNWQHLFDFNFDKTPTISLSRSYGGGFIERSSRFQEMMQQFSKTVADHKMDLSCFNVEFGNFLDFTNQNLNQLISEINKSLPDLKELSLNFAKCSAINKEAVGSLRECFRKNRGLERLSLNFDENPNIKGSFLAEISSDIKEYLRNLKSLTLSFENCKEIPYIEVIGLNKSLESLKDLENLDLNFEGCPNVGESIKTLFDGTLKRSKKSFNFNWKSSI